MTRPPDVSSHLTPAIKIRYIIFSFTSIDKPFSVFAGSVRPQANTFSYLNIRNGY